MDREAKLVEERKAIEAQKAEIERAQKEAIRLDKLPKGQRLKALKEQGITLDDLQEEYLEETKGSLTPEEIARRAARAEFERLEAEKATKAEAAAAEAKAKQDQEAQLRVNTAVQGLMDAFPALADELDQIQAQDRNAYDVLRWYAGKHGDYPQDFPKALKEYEQHLQEKQKGRGFAKAPPPKPAEEPPSGDFQSSNDKGLPVTRPRTAATGAVTPDDAGDVPLRPVVKRRETAIEKVQRLAREADQQN
jgi:hypothetical protein